MSFLEEALSSIREVIVSKPFDFLLGKLGSYISQFATEKQIHEGMHKLKMELLEIRAVLDDAEERQLKDQSVKIWLSNLQNLAYDLDDILDEMATEISRRNLMMQRRGGSSKKPRLMISDSYNTVMFNRDMMSKINDVTARLKDLEPQKNQLQLRMIGCHRSERIEERLQPTSVEIETHVYGRDEDKETILELLFNSDDEGSFVIPIIGMGGIGAKDFGGHPNLDEVAGKLVRKCNGLPLAAKTLGGLLRTNVDHDAWKDILESEIWKLSEHQCGIIPALQLSYHHLPPHLKKCFAYCSIFPKDYEFAEEEVILLWRAEGLLQEAQDKQRIELGHKYFRDLQSRSLLQISRKDNFRFIMHDLINDLAQSVAGELCFRMEGDKQISKQARHLSYIASECDGIKKFEGIWEAKHLRTFLPLRLSSNGRSYVTNYVLAYLLQDLKCLRVLSLEGYEISVLPDFIGDLKHLRFLDFSQTCITSLPESISTLYNLETLLLWHCYCLEKLPSKMENLVNLCYLDITDASISEGMPSNFGTLTNLQRLSNFVVSKGKGYQIRELKDLSNLKGRLCISGLENVTEIQDAWKAKLPDKAGLEELELEWSRWHFDNRIKEVEKKVLDFLQPSKGLKELAIKGYCGATLAKWVGDSSFDNLQSLCLEDCPNCMSLPSIGKLPSLKKVRINGLHSVTNVGVEFFGEDTPNAFPSLEILQFQDMLEWKNWNLGEDDDEAKKFAKLRELCICNCPKLMGTTPEFLPSLEKLVIEECEKLEISISSLPKLSELKIYKCKEVVYKGFANHSSLQKVILSDIRKFTCRRERLQLASVRVESLVIYNCEELFSLQENNWGFLTQSMSLGNLTIGDRAQLFSIGAEGEREELMQLKIPCSIKRMVISNCERLEKLSTTLQSITSLRVLQLQSCPKLISLSKNNLPLNLNTLGIDDCQNLRCLLDEGENLNIGNACLLEHLTITRCPSLISLSSRGKLPSELKELTIESCSSLVSLSSRSELPTRLKKLIIKSCSSLVSLSSRGELPMGLKELAIENCPKLESIAQEIPQNAALESITISRCDKINYLPQGLNKLSHLQNITLWSCPNLVSFPASGLPTTNLKVLRLVGCTNLQALPHGIHSLNCVEELEIRYCPSLTSFPEVGIPTTLRSLVIQGPNIHKLLTEWGLHRLTSLKSLSISNGCPDALSFQQEEIGMMLPCSLTTLEICDFPELEILSSNGFQNLTSLEKLIVHNCPKLRSLPEKGMLSSLLVLDVSSCAMLRERCEKDKGPEWSNIAHIPGLRFRL